MFTGIISDIGRVTKVSSEGDIRLRIATTYDVSRIDLGASIACDGICLTVVDLGAGMGSTRENWFEVEVSQETVACTNMSQHPWSVGRHLNLERALKVGDELGGHIVLGHVDGVATLVDCTEEGDSTRMVFEAPKDLAQFIAPKGSVTLNGTSLTVNEVDGCRFGVNVIPHTKAVTTWDKVRVGDAINLEIDTLARYVARLRDFC